MSNPEIVNPQAVIIKRRSSELGSLLASRHNPDLVSQFVQFSLGVASYDRLFGEEVDMVKLMQSGARIAASNLDFDSAEQLAADLLADEELCSEILVTHFQLVARGEQPPAD